MMLICSHDRPLFAFKPFVNGVSTGCARLRLVPWSQLKPPSPNLLSGQTIISRDLRLYFSQDVPGWLGAKAVVVAHKPGRT